MYISKMIIWQSHCQITISLNEHENKIEAERFAQYEVDNPELVIKDNQYAIKVSGESEDLYFYEENMVFLEISSEKRAKFASLISNSSGQLLSQNSGYQVAESDLVPSRYRLEDLFIVYGVGAKLNNVQWLVSEKK